MNSINIPMLPLNSLPKERGAIINSDGEKVPCSRKKVEQWRKIRENKKLEEMYQDFEEKFEKIKNNSEYSLKKKYDKYEKLLFDFNRISKDQWKKVIIFPSVFSNKVKKEMKLIHINF